MKSLPGIILGRLFNKEYIMEKEETTYNLQDKDDMVKYLAFEEGYSLEHIALNLGISTNQVLKRVMRKREKNTVRKPKVNR